MRIDTSSPFYTQNYETGHFKAPTAQAAQAAQATQAVQKPSGPGVIVDISPSWRESQPLAAANKRIQVEAAKNAGKSIVPEYQGCETCNSRRYQDKSNDPSVSFQAPTRISPNAAASAVAAHEREHVAHETHKAEKEGREIISQTVTIKTGICPECHRVYVAGGVTRTTSVESAPAENSSGRLVDLEV
jgi:hypothetical protein